MNIAIRIVAKYSTLAIIILLLLFLVSIFFHPPFVSTNIQLLITSYSPKTLPAAIISFLLVLAHIPFFAVLFYNAKKEQRIFAFIGTLFGLAYVISSGICYFLQISIIHQNIHENNTELIRLFYMNNPASVSIALTNLGYLFLSLAFLSYSTLFTMRRLESWIKTFCIIYGVSGLMGSVGFVTRTEILGNFVLLSALPYLITIILFFIYFNKRY